MSEQVEVQLMGHYSEGLSTSCSGKYCLIIVEVVWVMLMMNKVMNDCSTASSRALILCTCMYGCQHFIPLNIRMMTAIVYTNLLHTYQKEIRSKEH